MNKQEFKEMVEGKIPLQEGEYDKLWEEKQKQKKCFQKQILVRICLLRKAVDILQT